MADIRVIAPSAAAERLRGLANLDPRGIATEADIPAMCAGAVCLEVGEGDGSAVVVVRELAGVKWIEAAAGKGGHDLCALIDAATGPGPVAFQTKRRGLKRRAEKLGYHVAGYIMRRDT